MLNGGRRLPPTSASPHCLDADGEQVSLADLASLPRTLSGAAYLATADAIRTSYLGSNRRSRTAPMRSSDVFIRVRIPNG